MTILEDREIESTGPVADAPKRSWWRFAPLAFLALALIGIIANLFVPIPGFSGKAGRDLSVQKEANGSICAFAPNLATYDYKNIDSYFSKVLTRATGAFKDQFTKGKADAADMFKQGEVQAKVDGVKCGVASNDGDTIRIVIGISQQTASIATQGRFVPTSLTMIADVQKVGDNWQISNLENAAGK